MSDSDYEYTAHTGNHFVVTHQNGVPRYNAVKATRDRFTPLHPNIIGPNGLAQRAAQNLSNRQGSIEKAITDAGG